MNIFLLDELMAATELSDYHFLIMISLRLTATRMERVLKERGDLNELDELVDKRNALLKSKRLIDAVLRDYFASDGSIN
jgi:hypothetical protein